MIVRRILHALGTIAFFWRNPIRGLGLLYEDSKLMQKQKYDNFPVVKLEEITNGYYPVVSPVSFQTGGSGITDYVLIKSICSQYDQLDYLEIGTFKGESVQNILELDNLHRAVSITLPPDHPKIQKIENVRECEGIFIDQSNKKFAQIYADSLLYDFKTLEDKFPVSTILCK